MADFTGAFWSWFIGVSTVISLIALFIFVLGLSKRKTGKAGDKIETMGHVWDENLEELNTPLPRWWLYLFIGTLIWGAGYLLFYPGLGAYAGLLGWSQINQLEQEMQAAEAAYGPIYAQFKNTDLRQLAQNEAALKIGESLYSSYCTTCHGSDARGARGYPNLRDNDWLYGGEPDNIKVSILQGRRALMPAWGEVLSAEDIFNVTAYVEQLSGREVSGAHASLGGAIYQQNCAMCHGPDGKGNPMLGAANLTDDIWLYGGSHKKITESIVQGRNGVMPAHKAFLGEAKVHILAAYIYSLSN